MKILATVSLLSLLAAPAMAAETDAKPDAKADSSASMKHDGMMMMGDHDKMGGSMMMSADHAKMMSAKHKKAKAKAMTESSGDAAPGGTMMMSGKDKH